MRRDVGGAGSRAAGPAALAMNSCTASDDAMPRDRPAADGQASGGTVQHTSPGTPSRSRLVTTMRSPGTVASSRLTSSADLVAQALGAVEHAAACGDRPAPSRSASGSETPGWSCDAEPWTRAPAPASAAAGPTPAGGTTTSAVAQAAPDHLGGEPRLAGPARADET